MAVFKRKVTGRNGTKHLTNEYHYKFMFQKKWYYGVCEGCTSKEEAEKFEKSVKKIAQKGSAQRTAKALIENFRQELTGGTAIALMSAFDKAMEKNISRATEIHEAKKKQVWLDFVAWLQQNFPGKENLSDVSITDAEKYLAYIASKGRFNKCVTYRRGDKEITTTCKEKLSSRTQIFYHTTLKEVFAKLYNEAGLTANPFDLKKIKLESETREAFTQGEIDTIYKNADSFIEPLFRIAFATALREGDICTLRWDEIDFEEEVIRRQMRKTGGTVVIPIAGLIEYLHTLQHDCESEYVLPSHAVMYLKNPSGISTRIKNFLEEIGIKTTKKVEGRDREISIKDLHSCRHTFCYNAGLQGIPLAVVQSIVGHMTPAMTALYSAHATLADKRNAMNKMQQTPEQTERQRMIVLAKTLPIEAVRKILRQYQR